MLLHLQLKMPRKPRGKFRRRSAPIRPDPSLFQIVLDQDDRRKVAALCERGATNKL